MSELRSLLDGKGAFYSPGNKENLPREKGTYILILRLSSPARVRTAYGFTTVGPGIYAYVGSAFGPGGLRSRILRHWRRDKRVHWHIDWITTAKGCEHVGALVFVEERTESELARKLSSRFPSVPGFGASDSEEDSHLFKIG